MRIFFDRCFAKQLCAAITALESGTHVVEYHDDHFAPTTTDVQWLRAVGQWTPKPIVVSGDVRILRKPDELRELIDQDLTFIFLAPGWTNIPFNDCAWKFLKAWPAILREADRCRQPTAFRVSHSNSAIESIGLTKGLKK